MENGDLHERLLGEQDDSDHEFIEDSDGDHQTNPDRECYGFAPYYAMMRRRGGDFFSHAYTQRTLHTIRRFLVGGTKLSGTVAFAMYLNLIYQRKTLGGLSGGAAETSAKETLSTLSHELMSLAQSANATAAEFAAMGNLPTATLIASVAVVSQSVNHEIVVGLDSTNEWLTAIDLAGSIPAAYLQLQRMLSYAELAAQYSNNRDYLLALSNFISACESSPAYSLLGDTTFVASASIRSCNSISLVAAFNATIFNGYPFASVNELTDLPVMYGVNSNSVPDLVSAGYAVASHMGDYCAAATAYFASMGSYIFINRATVIAEAASRHTAVHTGAAAALADHTVFNSFFDDQLIREYAKGSIYNENYSNTIAAFTALGFAVMNCSEAAFYAYQNRYLDAFRSYNSCEYFTFDEGNFSSSQQLIFRDVQIDLASGNCESAFYNQTLLHLQPDPTPLAYAQFDSATGNFSGSYSRYLDYFNEIFNVSAVYVYEDENPFDKLGVAYASFGKLLAGVFIGFGLVDAILYNIPYLEKHLKPSWYAFTQGVDTGLIKVILLLAVIGECRYPDTPTREDFETGARIAYTNIPVCSETILPATLWSLLWLVPVGLTASYYEYNKHAHERFDHSVSNTMFGKYWQTASRWLSKYDGSLARAGLGISTVEGFLAFMDLMFVNLIPYGMAISSSSHDKMGNRQVDIAKLSLFLPALIVGVLVERRYQKQQEQSFSRRKILSTFNEFCRLMLFNYVALSFFISFKYSKDLQSNEKANIIGSDQFYTSYYNDGLDLSPTGAYCLILFMSLLGTAIVLHDEWFNKMCPVKQDLPDAIDTGSEDDREVQPSGKYSPRHFKPAPGNAAQAECAETDDAKVQETSFSFS